LKKTIFSLQMVRPRGLLPSASSSASVQATYQVFWMNMFQPLWQKSEVPGVAEL
jgi:hypothetical protein